MSELFDGWSSPADAADGRRRGDGVPLLALRGISREVALPDGGVLPILTGVDLEVDPGEHAAIVGRSGSGKSTLDICTLWHTPACDCSRHPSRLERWCAGRLRRRRRHGPGRRLLPDLR